MSLEHGTMHYSFEDFIRDVYTFNDIANSARDIKMPSMADLQNQFKVINEEVKELGEAIEDNNPVKILDGVVDALVTVLGLAQQLEELGYNVLSACKQVADDNLEKFVSKEEDANASVIALKEQGVNARAVLSEYKLSDDELFVLLDNHNKVRKPVGFKGTDLSEYIPQD